MGQQIGSFSRPKELMERRAELSRLDYLSIAQDKGPRQLAIKDTVQVQPDLGHHAITDG